MPKDVDSARPLPTEPPAQISKVLGWGILLFAGLAWGLSFSLAKIAVAGGAHPIGINFWQAAFGTVLLFAFNALSRRRVSLRPEMLRLYLIIGLLGSVIPGILFFYAAAWVAAGVLSITVTIVPVLTFLLAAFFGFERFAFWRIVGVLCGGAAVVLLVAPEASLSDPGAAPWILAACLASVCYAAENIVLALRTPEGAHPFAVSGGMFLTASLVMAPVVLLTDSFVPLAWPWGTVEWAITGMAAVSTIAYALYIYLVKNAGPLFASQTAYVVTLAGVGWGMLLFNERHSLWIWLSLALMMIGLALVSPRKVKRPANRPPT